MKSLILLSLLSWPAFAQTPSETQGGTPPPAVPQAEAKPGAEPKTGEKFAEAVLESRSGSKTTGKVTFEKTKDGIKVISEIDGADPGKHGFHVHENGDCSAPDASSAGGHYNPTGAEHAAPKSAHRHAGDLGNIEVKKNGKGKMKASFPGIKDFASWSDLIGKSVVVHAKADDLKTQPSGGSGDRIACGVIKALTSSR